MNLFTVGWKDVAIYKTANSWLLNKKNENQ